jgi:hypothetical protein
MLSPIRDSQLIGSAAIYGMIKHALPWASADPATA